LLFEVIDTHAHLDMPEFDSDRQEVIKRAGQSGINKIVTIGIDLKSSLAAVGLTKQYQGIYASVGIHPHESGNVNRESIDQLAEMAHNDNVVALGEMGLDYFRNNVPHEEQKKVFKWQLEIAEQHNLPVIIHCRQALSDMLEILDDWSSTSKLSDRKGIIHCYNGDIETANKYIRMGFYLALGGYIGYPSSQAFREVVKDIPLDRLVLETDCPFLPPQKNRGKRNEPAYILSALQILAEIKKQPIEEAARITSDNARTVLNIQA
jgi:TatD DNase family protein